MTDMEQILERLASLEQSVKTLTEMVSALSGQTAKVEYAVREKAVELAESPVAQTGKPIITTDHPLIIKIEGVRGGAPITRWAHISVHTLIGWVRLGETPEQIRADYEPYLSINEICDALSYYLHHPAEIDTILAENEAALERSFELSRLATERKKAEKQA